MLDPVVEPGSLLVSVLLLEIIVYIYRESIHALPGHCTHKIIYTRA